MFLNFKIRPPIKDTWNEYHFLKLYLKGDRVIEDIISFQEDDQSERNSYNEDKTVGKEKTNLAKLECA